VKFGMSAIQSLVFHFEHGQSKQANELVKAKPDQFLLHWSVVGGRQRDAAKIAARCREHGKNIRKARKLPPLGGSGYARFNQTETVFRPVEPGGKLI